MKMIVGLLIALLAATEVSSFHVGNNRHPLSSSWQLNMIKRIGKGKLGSEDLGSSSSNFQRASKKRRLNKKSKTTSKKKKTAVADISPGLVDWISQKEGEENGDSSLTKTRVDQEDDLFDEATTFTSFKSDKKTSSRRSKQKVRKAEDEKRNAQVSKCIKELEILVNPEKESSEKKSKEKKEKKPTKKKYTIEEILRPIGELLTMPSADFRQMTGGSKRSDYRLAWVGSDDAICHIGTSLHKVPLARLQEVFLSCTGSNRIEIVEIIRIIGPFPNVKNTIQGSMKIDGVREQEESLASTTKLQISYDSMIDGTGKEILAGKAENIRTVGLDIVFCDESAIIAVVPSEEKDSAVMRDPLENNGEKLLVFINEEDLDRKLQKSRVA